MTTTRERLLAEGMRLFGEQGYNATTVAQIERAAGLSPGSGSLYKHFRSKEELLSQAVDRTLGGGRELTERLEPEPAGEGAGLVDRLARVARSALRRMDEDRDLSRLLFRDLDTFPELLDRFGEGEIGRFQRETAAMLAELAGDGGRERDWAAVAVVLTGAIAHYWLMADLFGGHPSGVGEERCVAAAASVAAAVVAGEHSPS